VAGDCKLTTNIHEVQKLKYKRKLHTEELNTLKFVGTAGGINLREKRWMGYVRAQKCIKSPNRKTGRHYLVDGSVDEITDCGFRNRQNISSPVLCTSPRRTRS
jgi:hypothetical protein